MMVTAGRVMVKGRIEGGLKQEQADEIRDAGYEVEETCVMQTGAGGLVGRSVRAVIRVVDKSVSQLSAEANPELTG